jgi:hypothetical protein
MDVYVVGSASGERGKMLTAFISAHGAGTLRKSVDLLKYCSEFKV